MKGQEKTRQQDLDKFILRKQYGHKEFRNLYHKILENYFDYSLASIALLDREFNFICVNENYARANNKDVSYFTGKNHFDLYPSEEAKQIFKNVVDSQKTFQIIARPFVFPEKPGVITYWDWTLTPVLNESGQVELLILCLIDVTEKQRLKQEIERLDRFNLVAETAAGIGHEVRNPLTTVRGFLQLLTDKEHNSQKKEYYHLMIEELDRANSIITEFLSLAKDRFTELRPFSLNAVLNSIYPLLATDALRQDKYIVLQKGNIPEIPVNEHEIRQLVINLVKNGLEAMSVHGVLTIGTYAEGDEVVLYVADQGPGIDPDILNKLGNPFVTTKEKGTGLGVAVCYSIADRHTAKIDIKTGSAGTTFYVRFKIPECNSGTKKAVSWSYPDTLFTGMFPE